MKTNLLPLLLTIYLLIALISLIGKDLITNIVPPSNFPNSQLWTLYTRLSPSLRSQLAQQSTLKHDLFKTSTELKSTSSQDQFAKWARLNRTHEKLLNDLQSLTSKLDSQRGTFKRYAAWVIWFATSGVKGGVQWWYNRSAVFWLPKGMFPVWVEVVVAFPRAPRGMCQ
jgi:tail-anchored protein insertion receptor